MITDDGNRSWKQIFVYASYEENKRGEQLSILRSVEGPGEYGRVMMGDFNDILCKEEKESVVVRTEGSMTMFRDFVKHCGMLDLGFSGYPFTWWNKRSGLDAIKVCLDRVFCDP
ncbi:hypothetical protein LIER_40429 [Lithospermum erythrorhizon]|uniref:Uncharacterized protein n=1 Tax=Lithospermum erythrorhizon TaxID=34254 RepID=A0AAV3QXR9_LITER